MRSSVAVFRLVQEIINNIAKHAGATTVSIRVDKRKMLHIDIADNGRGINEKCLAKAKKGFGLQYISSRVRLLNGRLQLKTAENEGTRFLIDIPVEELNLLCE